jgi:hypothetical protein
MRTFHGIHPFFLGAIWGVIIKNERVLQEMDLKNPDCRDQISWRVNRYTLTFVGALR